MIPNEMLQLLGVWREDPFADFTISEVMKRAGKKTKPWVFNALKLLTEKYLLTLRKKGNINVYQLDLKNPCLMQTLQYLEAQKNTDFPLLDTIIETVNTVPARSYCLLVFGSYAENKQTKTSDLDICFLVEDRAAEKAIKPYFNEIKLECPVPIDVHYITFDDFVKMLLNNEENLGKQIFRKHKLFLNSDTYYQLIKEAYRHGFRP